MDEEAIPGPKISSPAGIFKGCILKSFSGQPFAAFRGIPFALPPVGSLRFAMPHVHPKIEGEYDATKEGPNCIQPIGVDCLKPGLEDCLYLNVFAPAPNGQIEAIKQGEKPSYKKVMVFIHGGGFFMGCANQHVPGDLVSQGDVVVVTLNYRLSWLGFVNGPIDELKGNMGMWDQLMALRWVKDNIRSFGGDADDITLAGQSMGGESVSALSISPYGKDLFTKGFLMSGTMFTCPSTHGSSDFLLDKLAERLGLPVPKPGEHTSFLETLRQLPEDRFHLPCDKFLTNRFTSIDGDFFPQSIQALRKDQNYLNQIGFFGRDYLVTLCNNEGHVLSDGPFISPGFTDSDEKSRAKAAHLPPSVYRKVLECYSRSEFESQWPHNDLCIDPIIHLPTFEFLDNATARRKDRNQERHGKSYFLLNDHKPTYYPPNIQGTSHGLDLCYLFDVTPDEILKTYFNSSTEKGFTEEDKRMKSDFIRIVVQFMKNGNPNCAAITGQIGKDWPAYEAENEYYLNFASKSEVKQFPMKRRRDLWKNSIPKWVEEALDK